jgi:hypothetical protein
MTTSPKYQKLQSGLSMSVYVDMSADEVAAAMAEIGARKGITTDRIIAALSAGSTFVYGPDFYGSPGIRMRDASAPKWQPKKQVQSCRCKVCGTTSQSRFTTLPASAMTCDDCA